MTALNLEKFYFRCADGNIVSVVAQDEQSARSVAMEQRWGPPQFNRTWACDRWVGKGLQLVDERGFAITGA